MCGYIGKISKSAFDYDQVSIANKHTVCRGPDQKREAYGKSLDFFNTKSLYHFSIVFNRLSIMELSDLGSQPVISEDNRYYMIFNGEIFNHNELRKELKNDGIEFRSLSSDTEVLFKGLINYGVNFINKLIGQFSIIFDHYQDRLYLIRDRLGQKPLFYKLNEDEILFGSNLKSMISLNQSFEIDEESLYEYLASGVVSSPNTIFKNFKKITPGSVLTISLKDFSVLSSFSYWDINSFVSENKYSLDNFLDIFNSAVHMRSKADVEVASFLSGGLDSTSIIKMQKQLGLNINSFSMGFSNKKYDESIWYKNVSKKYNTNHIDETINSDLSIENIFESIDIFDEPYADSSTIPSYYLSKSISKYYKVAISGDGGDELLGGYEHIHRVLNSKNLSFMKNIYNLIPYKYGTGSRFMTHYKDNDLAHESFFVDKKFINGMNLDYIHPYRDKYMDPNIDNYKRNVIADYKFYLSEMMLLKIDRTSMSNSLEVRSPVVDHRLVELSLSTDILSQFTNKPKDTLKTYLADDFDTNFLNRSKQGFAFQLEDWIFNNINFVNEICNDGIISQINSNIINNLATFKSRINSHRIWKIMFIERYLESI